MRCEPSVLCESTTKTSSAHAMASRQRGKFAASFLIGTRIEIGTFMNFLQSFDFATLERLARIPGAHHPGGHVLGHHGAGADDRAPPDIDSGTDEGAGRDPALCSDD